MRVEVVVMPHYPVCSNRSTIIKILLLQQDHLLPHSIATAGQAYRQTEWGPTIWNLKMEIEEIESHSTIMFQLEGKASLHITIVKRDTVVSIPRETSPLGLVKTPWIMQLIHLIKKLIGNIAQVATTAKLLTQPVACLHLESAVHINYQIRREEAHSLQFNIKNQPWILHLQDWMSVPQYQRGVIHRSPKITRYPILGSIVRSPLPALEALTMMSMGNRLRDQTKKLVPLPWSMTQRM